MTKPYNPELYWNAVAENISSRQDLKIIAGDDEPYYRYKRRRFLELLNTINFSDKTVLEIGSGPGGNLAFIYEKDCEKIVGVDISQQMVDLSKQLLTGKNIDVIKINGKDLPFADKSFDIVFTSTVLQHNTNERYCISLSKKFVGFQNMKCCSLKELKAQSKGMKAILADQ